MFKSKTLRLVPMLLLIAVVFAACGQGAAPEAESNPMEYITVEDLMASMEADSGEYVVLDVRKVEDYNKGTIVGSYSADVDAANKGGDDEAGIASLKKGLKEATGNETGNPDDNYVLVCYSGKSYAQKATDLLIEMGLSADQIFTLQNGIAGWEEGGKEYRDLVQPPEKPAVGAGPHPMEYLTVEDLMASIGADSEEYVILDVRKQADYEKGHIVGSYSADVDAANKGGDDEAGIASLKNGLKEATGSETGNPDDKYVLVCYSGKSYAQKATDLLIEMGLSPDQILTLQNGISGWEEGGKEYRELVVQ